MSGVAAMTEGELLDYARRLVDLGLALPNYVAVPLLELAEKLSAERDGESTDAQ